MRKPQNLMTTEDLFLYLLGRNLAEPKRLSANISRVKKGARYPGDSGRLEASLYLVYESPIFPKSPVGSAEIMAVQFPDVPEPRLTRLLEDALWQARKAFGDDETPAKLSSEVMERAELNAFERLLELPMVCLRQHAGVLSAARGNGLVGFDIPLMSAQEQSTLPANSTGFTLQALEQLASAAPVAEHDVQWDQSMDAAPGVA